MSAGIKLHDDLKQAMKSSDKATVSTLRLLISVLRYAGIVKDQKLAEQDVVEIIAKETKKRRESADAAKTAGRDDILLARLVKLELIGRYLPEQMSKPGIKFEFSKIIEEIGVFPIRYQCKVMNAAIKLLGGKADGKMISCIPHRLPNK